MQSKRININAVIRGDGFAKTGRLSGFAYVDAGFLVGDVASEHNFTESELTLLTAFSFTGCPIAARTSDQNLNPWRRTNGTYVGHRHLAFGNCDARSVLRAHGSAESVDMDLEIDIRGQLPELQKIAAPFQESIRQSAPGVLNGRFEMDFRRPDGDVEHAVALTRYELPIESQTVDAWRNITILAYKDLQGFHQIEQIDLFGDEAEAKADLSAKADLIAVA